MDANLRVSGTLEVNSAVQLQGNVTTYGLVQAQGGLNTTNLTANAFYATTSMTTPYLDAATTYVNYIYRKSDKVDGSIGTTQYPFGLVAAKDVYVANTPTDEHHAATKGYVDNAVANSGGSSAPAIFYLTDDNIAEAKEAVTKNHATMLSYNEEYVYVPTYGASSSDVLPNFYACCAADESYLRYLIIE